MADPCQPRRYRLCQGQRLLGVTGMNVVSWIFGLLLTALAVQFVFDGIKGSGLINV